MRHLLCALFTLCALWPALTAGAQRPVALSWASKDVHYPADRQPALRAKADTLVTAWRGERLGIEAVVYAQTAQADSLRVRLSGAGKGSEGPAAWGTARWMGYVLTDNFQSCGRHPDGLTPYEVADVIELDQAERLTAGQTRPVWCTVEVPRDARPGTYTAALELVNARTGKVVGKLPLSLSVADRTLPAPHDQKFYVDFWQQPYAVSGHDKLPRWSDAHFKALKPYLELLARSGQRTVSAILFYEPWGDQSHDKFDAMIRTTRRADGTWAYDYTIFDRWVELCASVGMDGQINCYSMVPWDMSFRYFDEATGKDVDLKLTTASTEYRVFWFNFLRSFAVHLRQKGWYERTAIAMDERGLPNMLDAYNVAQEAVPGIKMALAGSYHKELVDKLSDYCISYWERFTPEELAARRAKGWTSTTYVCCSTTAPNIFSNSLPVEATWLPLNCHANDFDGFLHWSWMNWGNNPLRDTRFRLFSPGDTYMIYPGPRSSVRYERFIEGIALVEKVRALRAEAEARGDKAAVERFDALMKPFAPVEAPAATAMSAAVDALTEAVNR